MVIGICGKSGSGKSTFASRLSNKFYHLDVDKIGHLVLTFDEVKKELVSSFGNDILCGNVVDRKKLSNIVFESKDKMDILTGITWKYMKIEIDKILDSRDNVVIDWLLLPKTEFFEKCDIKILLDVPYDIRKERITKRDNITLEDFELREKATYNYDKNTFDVVISNEEDFEREVIKYE